MSLSPRHLVRPRLSGPLSTKCRASGRRPWSLRESTTEYGLQYTTTHAGQTREVDAAESDLAHSPVSQPTNDSDPSQRPPEWFSVKKERRTAWKTRGRPQAKVRTSEEDHDSNTPSKSEPASSGTPVTPPLSMRRITFIMQKAGINLRSKTSVQDRINEAIASQNRFIPDRSLSLAVLIRANSIYTRELGLRQWKFAYEEIYKARHYKREVDKRFVPALEKEGQEMLQKVLDDCHGSFRQAWQAMKRFEKAEIWQRLAFWLLLNDPMTCLEFLLVTTETQEKPDWTMVADCLLYLDKYYYDDWLKDWKSNGHTYQSLIETCMNPRDWPIITLPQMGVRLYVRRASHEAVVEAIRMMKWRSNQITAETALCFMWRFIALGDVDQALVALNILPRLKDPQFTMESEGVMRHCCKLLTLDSVKDTEDGRNFRILPRLLEMGVRPNRDMMNVVLSNAFKTGDPQLGADMLHFMKTHHHEFDSYTYLTLLTDAVSRADQDRTMDLIGEIDAKEEMRKNPHIASKVFHYHYLFTVKHMDSETDPSSVFYSMLDLYNEVHDITPLKDLWIIPSHYTPRTEGEKMPPSPVALYLIVATFFRCQHRLPIVQRISHRFRELVLQGHPTIAPMAATDHTYNEFLMAFRRTSRGLGSCVRLVEDMLHTGPVTIDSTGKTIDHVRPTVRTWTILLSAFLYNGQPGGAEKIKEMMAKHHIQYNDVTWNTIINGYANSQNIPDLAVTIKAMEQAGYQMDAYTRKSLHYLREPERLWVALEELDNLAERGPPRETSIQEPQLDVSQDHTQQEDLLDSGLQKLARS